MYYNITSILVFTLLLLCLAAVAASPQYKVTETVHEDELSTVHEDELSNNTIISRRGELRAARAPRPPCSCADGQCGCCTGFFLEQLNVNVRQRGCMNITYDPDEFAFGLTMRFNDRVLYQNTVSGKNPRPVCVPIPRLPSARFCARFYNVYLIGRNIHFCVTMEGNWQSITLFDYSLNCFRMGVNGVSLLTPEDGGGLPQPQGPSVDPDDEDEEDYDPVDEEDDEEDDGDDDDDDDDLLFRYLNDFTY